MLYNITDPKGSFVPILVSVPHSGTQFPSEDRNAYKSEMIESPEDTDWFVHELYDFVTDMGITMIKAEYSRWVIDLNRNPESAPLYNDGRVITGLTPLTTFNGESIYKNNGPTEDDIKNRLNNYYLPYHQKIKNILDDWQQKYKHVLLFDAHSIKQLVPGIRKDKFPDLILGNADETSAHPQLIDLTQNVLSNGGYDFKHNTPFKGGYITRSFGMPDKNRHALQLEMSKTVYMQDNERDYSTERSAKIQTVLRRMFESLKDGINKLNQDA